MSNGARKKVRVAAFFAGAGGLDLGFDQAGFEVVYATDIDQQCVETLSANCGKGLKSNPFVTCADIRSIGPDDLPENIDFVIGGPPCQSFSASGRRAGGAAGTLDLRGELFEAYCRVLGWLKPEGFLFENVRGILATNGGSDWRRIQKAFGKLGYNISYRVLDALDYGAPQQRERLFMVGHKKEQPFLFPAPSYGPDSDEGRPHLTAGEALSGLKELEDLEPLYLREGKYAHLLPLVPEGSNYLHFTAKRGYPEPVFAYRSRFSDFLYKASPKLPVKTIIASPGKYTGPFHWDNRAFTVAEYKRLQGFPDNYVITGNRTAAIKQIGNSVSPMIAHALAGAIAQQLFDAPPSVELLAATRELSFDKRKGHKARTTRQLHEQLSQTSASAVFTLADYQATIGPVSPGRRKPNVEVFTSGDNVIMTVKADSSRRLFAKMRLRILDVLPKGEMESRRGDLKVSISLLGEAEHAVQTMWNAVDDLVIRSSNLHSLLELYGHFTEPHPIFEIDSFEAFSALPIARFAKHCADFSNCSKHLPRAHLLELFEAPTGQTSFLNLVQHLRSYRYDIRCHETNIAMPKGMYMVAYPFSLPERKQMNFSVGRSGRGKKVTNPRNDTNGVSENVYSSGAV